jgi:predicted membrane-bound mannosyltransferase
MSKLQNELNKTLWCILIAVILGIVGYVLWIIYAKDHNRYLQTFNVEYY